LVFFVPTNHFEMDFKLKCTLAELDNEIIQLYRIQLLKTRCYCIILNEIFHQMSFILLTNNFDFISLEANPHQSFDFGLKL
jgi:hypothetical protein